MRVITKEVIWADGTHWALCENEEAARRVRACLEACDGISVESLEAGYVMALEESHNRVLELLYVALALPRRVQAMRGDDAKT